MFDANQFKRSVKEWMREHPHGTEADLLDFCEEQIPSQQYQANNWLIEHTLSWYRHVLSQRRLGSQGGHDHDDAQANEA